MKIVIFCGGPGNRFWPLGRRKNPKQFLKVLGRESLLQQRYSLVSKFFNKQDIFISTGLEYRELIVKQLPKLPSENIILEPERRDTAAAVGLSAAFLNKRFPEEPMSILWQDHLVKNPEVFGRALKEAECLVKFGAPFVFIAVPAKSPNTHRGYIKAGKTIEKITKEVTHKEFSGFVEKPNLEQAKLYLEDGSYYWNPGYFIALPKAILQMFKQHSPQMYEGLIKIEKSLGTAKEKRVLEREFKKFEKNSIDYLVLNKLSREEATVLVCDMGWFDVGELDSLKEALQESRENVVKRGLTIDFESSDLLLYNGEKNKLLAAVGVSDLAIVNTNDVILVCHKEKVALIKKLLEKMKSEKLEHYL